MAPSDIAEDGTAGFVLNAHMPIFVEATELFNAYILVRKTGHPSLHWVGKKGYTAKRGDMKCKTAQADVGNYRLAGLVCSPFIHPQGFKDLDRRVKAEKEWRLSQHLMTSCPDFTATQWPKACATPYIMQANSGHPHYGVLAWVEFGIVSPKYVHGDYDLYAIVSADDAARREASPVNYNQGGVVPSSMALEKQLRLSKPLSMETGPLLFKIMNHLDRAIGYPMVMHAEQENLEHGDDNVIAFLPPAARRRGRSTAITLNGRRSIEYFYRSEFRGRSAGDNQPPTA